MTNLYEEFSWRGLIFDKTEGVPDAFAKESLTIYNGFDPTADSLHVGHLVPMVGLARMQRFGHHPVALAGGGTAMVGDPSGRSSERNLLSAEVIEHNLGCIQTQLASILDFDTKKNPARIVNNGDWLSKLSMIDFLRDVGKYFTVNYMLNKESVSGRMDREDGLSYTEFSYMLMQAYDFLHLHDTIGCNMQTGGSDQWGNITAGTTLVRKARAKRVHALVYPLITRADGTKFGKSADGGSIWLDPARTSPYRFYQFFINFEDVKVLEGLRFYTFLTQSEIDELAVEVEERPHQRAAQKKLAELVTAMVHGETALAKAQQASSVLFGGSMEGLDSAEIGDIFADVPSTNLPKSSFSGDGMSIVDLLTETKLASSKGDARRAIKGGAANLNNQRVTDEQQQVSIAEAIDGEFIVLRKGKRTYHLVKLID